jgi:aldose 1-epimerase
VAEAILLQQGDCRLSLDPAHGGAVREFAWRDRPVFRPTETDAADDPLAFSCFPMAPYTNRIAWGRFLFQGREVRIPVNWTGDNHPIHGQGWRTSWTVVEAPTSYCTLALHGGGDTWPWRYRCEQRFDLRDSGLTISLSIENLSEEAMPAAIGLHPYLPNARSASLRALLSSVWLTEGNLATEEVSTPSAWSFHPVRRIDAVPLDNSFSGWDGVAEIAWPDRRLRIRADGCPSLHVYTPADQDFFCVEPQTAPAGALNRGEATTLAPGTRLAIRVDFEVGAA